MAPHQPGLVPLPVAVLLCLAFVVQFIESTTEGMAEGWHIAAWCVTAALAIATAAFMRRLMVAPLERAVQRSRRDFWLRQGLGWSGSIAVICILYYGILGIVVVLLAGLLLMLPLRAKFIR